MLADDVLAITSIPKGSALVSHKITFFGKNNPDLGRVPICCVIIVVILDIPRINVGIYMGNLQIGSRKKMDSKAHKVQSAEGKSESAPMSLTQEQIEQIFKLLTQSSVNSHHSVGSFFIPLSGKKKFSPKIPSFLS